MTSSGWLMTLDERAPPLPSPGPDFLSSIPSANRPPRGVAFPCRSVAVSLPPSSPLSSIRRRLPAVAELWRCVTDRDVTARLLQRITEGDEEALRILWREYGRLAYTIAFRILDREDRAEDVVQELFIRIWKNAVAFHSTRADFHTWLSRVVRNLCIDMIRRKDPIERAGAIADVERWLSFSDPVESTIANRFTVRDAFLQIPVTQSRVLEMAYFEGLTYREIAERLGVPPNTVKSRMRLGLRGMRRYLEEMRLGEPDPAQRASQR